MSPRRKKSSGQYVVKSGTVEHREQKYVYSEGDIIPAGLLPQERIEVLVERGVLAPVAGEELEDGDGPYDL